ncbi:nuclear protein localization protein 4 homolog [Episyrphus balteatus]|uniref:nuclear protein localization protein 4 homolog n=1 Tax=Episyrphus balteatus TaxID=286459 RepID=UPI002486366A|nr:nuclear protein localization protein 4 homolog [Episyrphus balteatus]XP_055852774.1 nuclear protein localization protein 4 homolog [Episyrphus balteatus]
MSDKIMIRVQSPDGIKRIEIPTKSTIKDLYESIQKSMVIEDGFGLFKERNFTNELGPTRSQTIKSFNLKHGDMIYLKQMAGTSKQATASVPQFPPHNSNSTVTHSNSASNGIVEDDVDAILAKSDGRIQRGRDTKLCRHNMNGCCVHCSPIEPYDDAYLKEQKIKHLSFHSYIRKQTSGIDRGKYIAIDDISCKIKPGCREHPPWPKGICSKCQPSAITLNRQIYRHVDNVMFENTTIVERFLNYWRSTGHQRMGFLYGTYEAITDVPLGIRAKVAAIYEPPQESTRDSIKLLENEGSEDVDAVAKALGLKKIGWIFTDLIPEDPAAGTVKHIRGIETHFLTAQECIMAGQFQNSHPNPCKHSSNGVFGSKFATVCVTGDKTKQVHMEGYAVSAQCMALVRDDCLVPTKDAPELGYIRESTDKQYVPDVYYKEKDQYGNDVQRLARPLPVEYLLVDVPASTPLQPQYTFTQCDKKRPFPVENRYLDGHLQNFYALSSYLSLWREDEFLEAISDFHLLIYLYRMDMLPMKAHMQSLLEAVRTKNTDMANEFKKNDVWKELESLFAASSDGSGGTASYPSASSEAQGAETSTWTCNHCTFINRGDLSSCEICGLPR